MNELVRYLWQQFHDFDVMTGDMILAGDDRAMLHYLWPEGIAFMLFMIGWDIYLHRTKHNRVQARVAGLLFHEKDKNLSVICEYEAEHRDKRHVILNSTQWPELKTGTPVEVDVSSDAPTAGMGINDYYMAWTGILAGTFFLPAAWRDISAPHFSVADFLSQLAVSEAVLLGVVLIATPLRRLIIHHDVNRLQENLADMVRLEDLGADDTRRGILLKVTKDFRKKSLTAMAIAALTLFAAATSWYTLMTRDTVDALVADIQVKHETYRPDVDDKDRTIEVYSVLLDAPGLPYTPYVINVGLAPPPFAAGDKVRLRYETIMPYPDIDEGVVIVFLQTLPFVAWGALAVLYARRYWRHKQLVDPGRSFTPN